MRHLHYTQVPSENVNSQAGGAIKSWLLTSQSDFSNFSITLIEVAPKSTTERQTHPNEHAMYFLEGFGELHESNGTSPVSPGEFIYAAPNELHEIRNTGKITLKFLSVEPVLKEEKKVKG